MRILIAEDDRVSALVLRRTLEHLGHEVEHASDGTGAWKAFEQHPFRIVISDWMMPGIDGVELCRRIRALNFEEYPYLILLSAKGERQDRVDGLEAGADDFIVKPFHTEELHARLVVAERILRMQRELKNTEMQLLHSAKLASLGTLATGVAHELNQPLAVIRGVAQQLRADAEMSEEFHEDLDLITGQTDRMVKIINHLRTFARAPGLDSKAVAEVNEVVSNCFILIGEQLKSRGIQVELRLSEEKLEAVVDANELEQVVLNLVTNARDAIDGRIDATITIVSYRNGANVLLEVRDNGPGVPPNLVNQIMDPFFTTKEAGKGTGLGLSISHSIVERYKGSLEYCTEAGAVFAVSLPANVAAELLKAA